MHRLIVPVAILGLAFLLVAQKKEPVRRLPDGRLQSEAILEADHKKSLEDADELVTLIEQLKAELEKNERHVLSISSIRTAEKIEKIAKRIKNRLKRY